MQTELLEAFFHRDHGFFLTGGAALVGFHVGHRVTHDLDLFTLDDALDTGEQALGDSAREIGAEVENIQTAPTFRRRLVRRGDETVVVDLVLDQTEPVVRTKPVHGVIRVDPPLEILANKLCALLSRAELRDLVDVRALEDAGFRVEEALPFAQKKDAGLTPAQLSWVLSQYSLGGDAELPEGITRTQLEAFLKDLQIRLNGLAFPDSEG